MTLARLVIALGISAIVDWIGGVVLTVSSIVIRIVVGLIVWLFTDFQTGFFSGFLAWILGWFVLFLMWALMDIAVGIVGRSDEDSG